MKYFMSTDRLGFRRWEEGDFGLALTLWGDEKVTKLIDARGRLSGEQVRERLEAEIATEQEYGVQYWPIFLLASDEHVGCAGLRPHDAPRRVYEVGVHLRPEYWGRGYAHEAAREVMRYAFDVLKAGGLFAGHNPANEPSRRLLMKLGFRYTHDQHYAPTGLNHPSYMLTAEEYACGKAGGDA